jgi:serine/threonine-protein kinase
MRERFRREGYAANRVGHGGAVRVLRDDVARDGSDGEETAYLVMELLEGESLEARIVRAPAIGERELLSIAHAVLEVLEAAHEHGVVHRDLKPDNVFLARDPDGGPSSVKVLDFGLARIARGGSLTRRGLAMGTPSYMSPEQATGRTSEIDGRTDLFALGATGFRILASRRVHEAKNAAALMVKMAKEPAPRLRTIAPHVSAATAAIIDRALEFRLENRYTSAAAMRSDVEAALADGDQGNAKTVLLPAVPGDDVPSGA